MSTRVATEIRPQSQGRLLVILNLSCRLILAATFGISSIQKVIDPTRFQTILDAYHLGPGIVSMSIPIVPLLEFSLSLMLLFGIGMRMSTMAATILLCMYTALMGTSLVTGNVNHGCGCFFGVQSAHSLVGYIFGGSSITIADVLRDLILLAMACGIWFTRDPKLGLDKFWTNSRAYWRWYRGKGYFTGALIFVFVISTTLAAIAEGNIAKASNAPLSIAQDFGPSPTIALGQNAPDFSLADIDGTKYSLKQYRGKVVLLEFFAVWCSNCHEEAPIVNRLQREIPSSRFQILSIISSPYSRNYETSNGTNLQPYGEADVKWYQHAYHVANPILIDPHFSVTNQYIQQEYPNLIVINAQGRIKDVYIGPTSFAKLSHAVSTLISGYH